jgi:hypothetical protein
MYPDLESLIEILKAEDPEKVVPNGFHKPHSYRGHYSELAVQPAQNVTVRSMLECLEGSIGKTFHGYKGGTYKMAACTSAYLAEFGSCGEQLGPTLLKYMLKEERAKE